MIRSLSPYYITTPLEFTPSGGSQQRCEKYTLNIWAWNGDKDFPVSDNSYQVTFKNTANSYGSHDINISKMIQDFIEFTPIDTTGISNFDVVDGNNQMWVYTFVTYNDETTRVAENTELYSLGYSYGDEGKNYQAIPNNIALTTKVSEYRVSTDGYFILPIYAGEDGDVGTLKVYEENDTVAAFETIVYGSDQSSEGIRYFWIDMEDVRFGLDYLRVVWKGTTIILRVEDECKYAPINVMFQNKDGALQSFSFMKKQVNSLSITDKSFESNRGQASDGFHQFIRYNVQATESGTANTGFIKEAENETITQLILSERTWIYDGVSMRPINIKDMSKKFKTRLDDRLIDYEIKYETAYNKINNI
tara:strand:+ start:3949 stop:5034 length:1086 start_codon:yes stop_codon:yes gene_type:complete